MTEKTRENKLKREVLKRGGIYRKLAYVNAGDPDRLILLPGGRSWFVELKTDGKEATPLQLNRLKKIKALGFNTKIINSEKSYLDILIEFDLL
jgi:hypothetical protein